MDPETFTGDLLDPDLGDKNRKQVLKTWLKKFTKLKSFHVNFVLKLFFSFWPIFNPWIRIRMEVDADPGYKYNKDPYPCWSWVMWSGSTTLATSI